MKIAIAGDWLWPQYEEDFACALSALGHEIFPIPFRDCFGGVLGGAQRAVPIPGPALWRVNRCFLKTVSEHRPDVVLVWRGTHVLPWAVRCARNYGALVVSNNNDDAFAPTLARGTPWHHRYLWMWYRRGLREFDVNFVYRAINVRDAARFGAKNIHLLRSYFVPARHRPIKMSVADKTQFASDVVFVGHYEPDGREECIGALVEAGLKVRLFGGSSWTREVLGEVYQDLAPVVHVAGLDYARALCGARVCLAFLSKLNRDSYTRRCFEIPACGRVMLAERTDDLLRMFKEDEEACFFSSTTELVEKAKWLIANPDVRERIGRRGMERVWHDGHDVGNRAAEFADIIQAYRRPLV